MKQAFLLIKIQEIKRDAVKFICIDNLQSKQPVIYRFRRVFLGWMQAQFFCAVYWSNTF